MPVPWQAKRQDPPAPEAGRSPTALAGFPRPRLQVSGKRH